MILKVLITLWVISIIIEIYLIAKKHKYDKANYRYLVCEQHDNGLIPIDVFNCEADAHAHYIFRRDVIIIRISSSDLEWYKKHGGRSNETY